LVVSVSANSNSDVASASEHQRLHQLENDWWTGGTLPILHILYILYTQLEAHLVSAATVAVAGTAAGAAM
jgi:cyanophycinase-like exopeptidase